MHVNRYYLGYFCLLYLFDLVQVTGHTFEVETDTFKLRNIMEAPLLKYKEEIEVSEDLLLASGDDDILIMCRHDSSIASLLN